MQSLKNKTHILESLLDNKPYNVVCLTETWIRNDQKGIITVRRYEFSSTFCRQNHRGGGTAILTRTGLNCKKLPDITNLSIEYVVECCAIEIKSPKLIIILVYRPDRNIEQFFNFLNQLLKLITLKYRNKRLIITGDFNLDYLKKAKEYQKLNNIMTEINLHQIIKIPTRTTKSTSTCIDLLFTNNSSTEFQITVNNNGISDHNSLIYSLRNEETKSFNRSPYVTKRIFNNINLMNFQSALNKINWNDIFNQNLDIDQTYNKTHDILQSNLNTYQKNG